MVATLLAVLPGVALVAFAAWRHGRPPDPLRPRLIPWVWLMLIGVTWTVVMIVHAVNLLGVHTGRNGF